MNCSPRAGIRVRFVGIALAMCSLVVSGVQSAHAGPLEIVYPGHSSPTDKRVDYYIKLLDLALSKTGIQYELRPNQVPMVSPRVFQKMEANDGIDVTWGPTTREFERHLLPIRIPLDKGILGWRLFPHKVARPRFVCKEFIHLNN